jgi:multimeric flavodoxin WrbA
MGFIGSSRKGGNTDLMVSEILSAAEKDGAETEKIYLGDQNIKPCLGCDGCHKIIPPRCVQTDDDFNELAKRMRDADAFVFGTPVYWFSVSGQLKMFMDRWASFLDMMMKSRLRGKSASVVVCCGDPNISQMTDPSVEVVRQTLSSLGISVVDCLTVSAYGKGQIAKNPEAMEQAAEAGRKLAAV